MIELTKLLPEIKLIAAQAAKQIMPFYKCDVDKQQITYKPDHSPVTIADQRSHEYIVNALTQLTPDIPIVSEEMSIPDFALRRQWARYWLVDPLDGTKEFIDGNDEFAINIALIDQRHVVLGVIYLPTVQTCYYAAVDHGAYKQVLDQPVQRLQTRQRSASDPITIMTSRRHRSAAIAQLATMLPQAYVERCGSSIKLCLLAEGNADVYTRFGNMLEWDLAAGQCIVEQAGGCVSSLTGEPLMYNTMQLQHPNFFAIGCCDYPWQSYVNKIIS